MPSLKIPVKSFKNLLKIPKPLLSYISIGRSLYSPCAVIINLALKLLDHAVVESLVEAWGVGCENEVVADVAGTLREAPGVVAARGW